MSPEMPITAQVVKYPSARVLTLGRGLWELKNSMVRRNKGGAIEQRWPRRRAQGAGRSKMCCSPWFGQCGIELVDAVQADGTEERATTGCFGFLYQRRLLLRESESYNCGKRLAL
jgi:hypothetical protein